MDIQAWTCYGFSFQESHYGNIQKIDVDIASSRRKHTVTNLSTLFAAQSNAFFSVVCLLRKPTISLLATGESLLIRYRIVELISESIDALEMNQEQRWTAFDESFQKVSSRYNSPFLVVYTINSRD